jgi:tetratricopeptide (TPR) repeat protein
MYWTDPRLWDLNTGAELGPLRHSAAGIHFLFTPDSKRLLTIGSNDIHLVDPVGGQMIAILRTPTLRAVTMDTAGKLLATASGGSGVDVWDLEDGRQLAHLSHEALVEGLAFAPDGRQVATVTSDGTIRLWQLVENELVKLACDLAGRNLTYQEWTLYVPNRPYGLTCPQWPVHPTVYDEMENLARLGDVTAAETLATRIMALDDDFTEAEAEQRIAQNYAAGLVSEGSKLASASRVLEALALFEEAQRADPAVEISSANWINICYQGALAGLAAEVLDACNRGITLDDAANSTYWLARIYRGRAIVQTQLGLYNAAVTALQVVLASGNLTPEAAELHRQWIGQLLQGINPFDEITLEALSLGS